MGPQISKEELQRRKQSKGKTYSTAEVLARPGEARTFRVEWIPRLPDELTTIWTVSRFELAARDHFRDPLHRSGIDDRSIPADGIAGDDDERVLFAYPLGVQIEVDFQRRRVWVLHVWRFRRRGE